MVACSTNLKKEKIKMRIVETKVYKLHELSDEAKERVIQNYRERGGYNDDFWGNERLESYQKSKEIYDQLESIEGEISGARLVAWIENNLSHLWRVPKRIGKHKEKYSGVVTKRRQRNGFYFSFSHYEWKYDCIRHRMSHVFEVNEIDGCPLTGVCYDYDFLEPVINFMKNPKESTTNLDLVSSVPSLDYISQRDWEEQNSDEFITDQLEANDYEFTEDGKIF